MNRNTIYDCTTSFEDRKNFLGEMLSYKKLGIAAMATLEEALEKPDALIVLFDPALSEEVLARFSNRSQDLELLRVVDCLVHENGRFWPRSLYRQAFRDVVYDKSPALDTSLRCYVAGDHPLIPVALESFSRLGYSQFYWIAGDRAAVAPTIERLRRYLIGMKINSLQNSELNLQANNGSLILNGITAEKDQAILDDLAYLNFLRPPGLILDLEASEPVDWGVSEEDGRGFPIVSHKDLLKVYDSVLMKALTTLLTPPNS